MGIFTRVPGSCWSQAMFSSRVGFPAGKPQQPLHKVVKGEPKLQWKPQDSGCARTGGRGGGYPLRELQAQFNQLQKVQWVINSRIEKQRYPGLLELIQCPSARWWIWSWRIWHFACWVLIVVLVQSLLSSHPSCFTENFCSLRMYVRSMGPVFCLFVD